MNAPLADAHRTVLVTGGTRGLGLAITRRLAREGYRVVAAARSPSADLRDAIAETPRLVHFQRLDLSEFDTLHDTVRSVVTEHGRLYALINNAAIARSGVLATLHDSEVTQSVAVNVTGTILLTKYALRSMLLEQQGRVVNVASIIADTGFNGLSVYGATKAALVGFTRSLAREVGKKGITVNAVLPGYMDTDMSASLDSDQLDRIRRRSALRRLVTVEEVAGTVAYLLSEEASGVSGSSLTIDAGSTA
jgi:3-oxoacyl-[acyl-carrier protein] reductase